MKIPYSKWQTQRRCSPDQKNIMGRYHWILVKGCSRLRLTYQIRYLGEAAEKEKAHFLITVSKGCRVSPELQQFVREHRYTTLKRVDRG
ncbi:MAG: hypothetical protein HFF11_01220 [Angelakisella sp.]|jgi:hypothetical protein|nr:hypothetical protein [Angelakisella sp.]